MKISIRNEDTNYHVELPDDSMNSVVLYQFVQILGLYYGYEIGENTILDVLERIKDNKR
jgi:hypothetical protein